MFPVHNSRRIMNTANNTPCGLTAALSIAYKTVMTLGYTHKQLENDFMCNRKTLQRIKNGDKGRDSANKFYLETFLKIIDDAYQKCFKNGGEGATPLLKVMREILMAEHCLLK